MTVAELIAKLQAMPQDARVLVVDTEFYGFEVPREPKLVTLTKVQADSVSNHYYPPGTKFRNCPDVGEPFAAVTFEPDHLASA